MTVKPDESHRAAGAAFLPAIVVVLKPFSNLFLALGVRHVAAALLSNPLLLIRALFDPLVVLGVAMQILWLLTRMALLSAADLTFVLPVTAVGYVLSTLLGRVFLHEQVSLDRWLGTLLIFAGAVLVAGTAPRSGMSAARPAK